MSDTIDPATLIVDTALPAVTLPGETKTAETQGDPKPAGSAPVTESPEEKATRAKEELWKDQLAKELKDKPEIKDFKGNLSKFAEETLKWKQDKANLEERIKNAIIPPTEKSSADEISAYHLKRGVPEKVEGYELKSPEGIAQNDSFALQMAKAFKSANLPKADGQLFYNELMKLSMETRTALQAQRDKETNDAISKMKEELGSRYEPTLKQVKTAVVANGNEQLWTKLEQRGFGNDPDFVKFVASLGSSAMAGRFIKADNPPPSPTSVYASPEWKARSGQK